MLQPIQIKRALAVTAALCAGSAPASAQHVGNAVGAALNPAHNAMNNRTWGDSAANRFELGWLVQTPPTGYWNQPYATIRAQEAYVCDPGVTVGCDQEFGRYTCVPPVGAAPNPCTPNVALPAQGTCAPLRATQTTLAGPPRDLCLSHSDVALLDRIWDIVANANQLVDIVSLHNPKAEYAATINNALLALHAANPPGPGPAAVPIVVRVFYSDYPGGGTDNADTVVRALTANLPAPSRVRVSVAQVRYQPSMAVKASWNHSKIVAADGVDALVGGHNFYQDHYLEDRAVRDVSIRVKGPAALQSQQYADELWAWACNAGNVTNDTTIRVWGAYVKTWDNGVITGAHPASPFPIMSGGTPTNVGAVCPNPIAQAAALAPPPLALPAPGGAISNVRVFGVGRMGGARPADQQADVAILAMINSAQQSIKIAQQNLFWGPLLDLKAPWGDDVAAALARKIMEGVQIDAVVSNFGRGPATSSRTVDDSENLVGAYRVGVTNQDYPANHVRDIAIEVRKKMQTYVATTQVAWVPAAGGAAAAPGVAYVFPTVAEIDEILATRFRVAALRASAGWDSYPGSSVDANGQLRHGGVGKPGLHSKLIIVDDQAFYVGSHNLYQAGLSEYGFIVDDAPGGPGPGALTTVMLNTLWTPMWNASARTAGTF